MKTENAAKDAAKPEIKPIRRKVRNYTPSGVLSGIDPARFPQDRLYWIAEDPKAPGRISELTVDNDYELVTEAEAGLRNPDGTLKNGSTVTRPSKDGKIMYLARIPKEYYNEDMKERKRNSEAKLSQVAHQNHSKLGNVPGITETSELSRSVK